MTQYMVVGFSMDISSIIIVILLCATGAWTLARSDPSLKRSLGKNIWILLVTFGPAIISAVLLPWWTFFIALIATMSLSYYFRQLLGDKAPSVAAEVLDHAKRIVKVSEHFYNSVSTKSPKEVKKDDVMYDISTYCLYITFKELVRSGYKTEDSKYMMEQLAKHIAFYADRDATLSNYYLKGFMHLTELLRIDSSDEEAGKEMAEIIKRNYKLTEITSVLETTLIEKLDSLIKVETLVKSLR